MHCYFILAGNATIPILFHVERVRDGRSFITRTVQARQRGKCIFTTTISFMAEGSGGNEVIQHGADMPADAVPRLEKMLADDKAGRGVSDLAEDREKEADGEQSRGPFVSKRLGIANNADSSPSPHERHVQSWLKCRGTIRGGIYAHLSALAYMTDNTFIGVVSKVHGLERFGKLTESEHAYLRQLAEEELMEHDSNGGTERATGRKGSVNTPPEQPRRNVGMMVSLDHTIYFHRPREIRADEWLFSEMESPWAGQGRGCVTQRLWNRDGRLVASCVQEGLVRLQQQRTGGRISKL
ncbi:uncharacterized protein KY384_006587 [Bacidia gigantensis]|uniref:uncharacterized protein n=1 Tax=Bacidia gigantensis TaxID=2732470 RepID=UPI001D0456A6|nr:uncharacterized protein KY384_006587 [Bacidia gigantensis]KAG8528898.1 hypothetical protein KY384_006587 [Bacidia gigantensis]